MDVSNYFAWLPWHIFSYTHKPSLKIRLTTIKIFLDIVTIRSEKVKSMKHSYNRPNIEGMVVWWLFPRVRGFGENVRQLIPRLRFFLK